MRYRALKVRQPYAGLLATPLMRDGEGALLGIASVLILPEGTDYRGEVLVFDGRAMLGLVELYDAKPAVGLTPDEWTATCIPEADRAKYRDGVALFFRNPRRVVDVPLEVPDGFSDFESDEVTEYPQVVRLGNYRMRRKRR